MENSATDVFTCALFSHSELFDVLTQSRLFRYKNATMGILSFFREHPKLITRTSTLAAMKFFNRVGGARELVAFPESFFKLELEKKFSTLIIDDQQTTVNTNE